MSQSKVYIVSVLLDKMDNEDRDIRYMAINDLMNELESDMFEQHRALEPKVCHAIVRRLEDSNSEVQNFAAKSLGPLVEQFRDDKNTMHIIQTLCKLMEQGQEEPRDVASIGLKTVIQHVPQTFVNQLTSTIVPILVHILQNSSHEVQLDALEILKEVVSRFGTQMTPDQHKAIQPLLLNLLSHHRATVRKRSTLVIGYMATYMDDKQFGAMMAYLLDGLAQSKSEDKQRTLIHCAGTLSRRTNRTGAYLPQLVQLIVNAAQRTDDAELCEVCLQTLESFVLCCPKEATPFINDLLHRALEYINYDPNIVQDEEDNDDMDTEGDEEDEEDDDILDDDSDDDDLSWKVRRAAAKLLSTIIETRPELLDVMYHDVAPALITRFRERDAYVRVEIMETFSALLRQTHIICGGSWHAALDKSNLATAFADRNDQSLDDIEPRTPLSGNTVETRKRILDTLRSLVPRATRDIIKQLSSTSTQTRLIGFRLLSEMTLVLQGGLEEHIDQLLPPIIIALSGESLQSNLKLEVLAFLRLLLQNHSVRDIRPVLSRICPTIGQALSDPFYKIVTETLLVCIQVIKVIRPHQSVESQSTIAAEESTFLQSLFSTLLSTLSTNDVDQEVKKRATICLGVLLAFAGDVVQQQLPNAWEALIDRVRNEVTRLTTARVLTHVIQSPRITPEVLPFIINVATELGDLLKKNDRNLRIACLECLIVIFERFGAQIPLELYTETIVKTEPLLSDVDLHLLPLALRVTLVSLQTNNAMDKSIIISVMACLQKLVQSPLLQGAALTALLDLFTVLSQLAPDQYQSMVTALTGPFTDERSPGLGVANKQVASTVSQCVGVMATNANANHRQHTIDQLLICIKSSTNDTARYISLLTLGEIGCRMDLSTIPDLEESILAFFSSESEELKFAAASALGNLSIGHIEKYLPIILRQIHDQPKRRYLLLHSLKRIIVSGKVKLDEVADDVWEFLLKDSEEDQEDGTRTIIAECLGKLALSDPVKFLPKLQAGLSSPSVHIRTATVTALKYPVVDSSRNHDDLLESAMTRIVMLLKDTDRNVQRLALLTINSAAHCKPYLVKSHLQTLIPLLYEETQIKDELKYTVEMGPFKHEVDDGLEIRKAAFECMYTLMDTCLEQMNVYDFLDRVHVGLADHSDIKLLSFLILIRCCKISPAAVTQRLDQLVDLLTAIFNVKLKPDAVKQDKEKNQEMVRATLRCVMTLSTLPHAGHADKFDAFVKGIQTGPLSEEYKLIAREAENRDGRGIEAMDLSA